MVSHELCKRGVATIQGSLMHWSGVFEAWCGRRFLSSYQCPIAGILLCRNYWRKVAPIPCWKFIWQPFRLAMRELIVLNQAHAHLPFSSLKGLVTKSIVPSLDLIVVLEAMSEPLFEPLESLDLRMLFYKTILLLVLASAKCVFDLHACIPRASNLCWIGQEWCCVLRWNIYT